LKRVNRLTALILPLLVAALLAGCGSSDDPGPEPSPPAGGERTPPSGTPGVPDEAPYDLDGEAWREASEEERLEAADAYVADNPQRCGEAEPLEVSDYVTVAYGLDFPLWVPAVDVLAEGCDAARQS
jgi:hypothetical protein